MNQPINLKTGTLAVRNSISPATAERGFLLVALALTWFALSPVAQAQLPSPTPDGGYPNDNTAEGTNALFSLTTGSQNTANGSVALEMNTMGSANTAAGYQALASNTTGSGNTANGANALLNNTTADDNTAAGFGALQANTSGTDNTANGFQALLKNTTGIENTAHGANALMSNTTASCSTANGYDSLRSNTTGGRNTATGWGALELNTTGGHNTGNGYEALYNNKTGGNNIALGYLAGHNLTTGSNNIDIGNQGVAAEANTIRIGTAGKQTATYIAGISGVTIASGVGVIIDTNGHLGTVVSSERFKEAIKPMDKASEAILALRPVTFRYKRDLDPDGIPQFGLVAEEVEKVNPGLVVRDAGGKVYTVRYEAVNAMLLNEFLKEHRKVDEQEATISQLKSTVAQQQKDFQETAAHQQKQIETLSAGLQKVGDQLEASKAAPQLVVTN
jgi:hypothetical protein